MARINFFERPKTLEAAVAVLQERGNRACVHAGGTSLALRRPPGVDTLVDLGALGLEGIEDRKDSVSILAMTSVADLAVSPAFKGIYSGVVNQAAARVASTPLRNLITVGGNLVQVLPWSDLPGVFLALDAQAVIGGPSGRVIPLRDLYADHPRNILSPADIVTEIRVPKPVGRVNAAYVKVTKTAFDYAALSVTAVCSFSGQAIRDCCVVLGSVRPLPKRVPQAEEEVTDKIPTRDDFIRAAARAAGAVDPTQDNRYSAEYKRHLIKIWVKRCMYVAAN